MNKKLLTLGAAMALMTSITLGVVLFTPRSSEAREVQNVMVQLDAELEELEASADNLLLSSNPYDYKALKSYQALVEKGIPYLPTYYSILKESRDDGLKAYLLTLAIEEITGADFKQTSYASSTAQTWLSNFEEFKEDAPALLQAAISKGDEAQLKGLEDHYGLLLLGVSHGDRDGVDILLHSESMLKMASAEPLSPDDIKALEVLMTP